MKVRLTILCTPETPILHRDFDLRDGFDKEWPRNVSVHRIVVDKVDMTLNEEINEISDEALAKILKDAGQQVTTVGIPERTWRHAREAERAAIVAWLTRESWRPEWSAQVRRALAITARSIAEQAHIASRRAPVETQSNPELWKELP